MTAFKGHTQDSYFLQGVSFAKDVDTWPKTSSDVIIHIQNP